MPIHELSRNELRPALDQFSRTHQGWRTLLEDSARAGERREIRELPLVGLSADDRDGENRVVILLGNQPDRHLTHIVAQPTKVRIIVGTDGSEETVEIETKGGGRTLVHCYTDQAA